MRRAIIFIFLAFSLPALAAGTWSTLTVPTTRHAYSIGYSNGPVISCGAQDVIKSADGTTWSLKTTTSASYPCYSVHFPSSSTGYIVGADSNGSYVANNRGRWWKSTDNGDSWTAAQTFTFSGAATVNDYYDVYFTDNNTGWAVGWPCWNNNLAIWVPNIIKTTDGGAIWAKKATGIVSGDNAIFFGLHFYNSSIGWAAGGPWAGAGVVYRTLDGGDNWTPQTTGSTQPFADVYFLKSDYNHGFLCGWNGTLYKTSNGGDNWSAITTSTTASLTAVTFINPEVGYAVGDQGTLLKSTDQGNAWTSSTPGAGTETFTDIYFKDAFHGWISGNNGNVLGFSVAPTVSPSTGNPGWSGYVTITGDNFYARNASYPAYNGFTASSVSFGSSIEVTTLEVISATEMRAHITIYADAGAGVGPVTVTDPDNGGTCATAFTITTTPTGDAGPTISNVQVENVVGGTIGVSDPKGSADIEDATGVLCQALASGQLVAKIYLVTTGYTNNPLYYKVLSNSNYVPLSPTRGRLYFTLTRLTDRLNPAANPRDAIDLLGRGTQTPFSVRVYIEDKNGNGSQSDYGPITFSSTLTTQTNPYVMPPPNRTPPFTFQLYNPTSFAGPIKVYIHNINGQPIANLDANLVANVMRTNVVWDGRTIFGEHAPANGMYTFMANFGGYKAKTKFVVLQSRP